MKKLNKTLSVLLTFVMLFTTFCFFPLDLGAVEADAAVAGIKIVVPETLYLTPSTGASTTIQYYINNNADGSVSVSQDTSAKVHITYPGAKLTSVSAKTSAAITLPASITGLVGTTFGSSATTATGTFSLPAGLNAGGTALVEWTFVFEVNGKTQTHYAYSVAYAPWYQPVGAAARAVGSHHNVYSSSILWVSGVHGYATGDSANVHYPKTATFLPMLGVIQAPSNTGPDTYIQSGSNGLAATVSYQSISESGVNYHARANSISPTANLTVDTSRYNNFNQIPNFRVGFMVTDRENANEGKWYVSDYGTNNGSSYYNGTARSGSRYDGDYNDQGTSFTYNDADTACAVKYNAAWNKAISGTANFRIKSGVYGYHGGVIKSTSWNNNFVNISVTGANKGSLRTNVLNGTSYAKENYTADTWNTYYSALKTAATNLCNPTSATVDTSALTTAEAGLHTTLTLNANGGAIGDGVPNTVAMQVGGGTTSSFNNADVINAYYATRTGYTFLGWSTDKDATSAPATVTVGFNDTVYAVWEANKYQVVFDNLIDYPAWNKAAGNGTVSDITDNGFTITSNDGAGESTSESPYFPVTPGKKYKVHMDITGTAWDVYIFFCDEGGNWVDFKDGPTNRYSTGGSTGVDPENAIFTAPDKAEVVKAKIRVDANGIKQTDGTHISNTVRFENIRVFEVDNENADISYEAPIMVTYDQPFGTLPTPTRTGYEFQGWVDENGTPYASSTTVAITETLRLYSTWELGTYTITFDTKGGNAINSISGHYGDAVTKPADPTKPGYLFTGWDKTVPDTIPPENTTITATWSENSYAVFFDGNGQTGGTAPEQINTTYTGEITIPECTYEKTGYTFSYWTTNKDGTGDKFYPGEIKSELTDVRDGSVTLYAQWAVNSYNITYVYDNGTGETKVIPFDINATVNALAAPEKTGYTFAGWKVTSAEGNWELGAVVDEGVTATGMYGNVTLTAQWTANKYTITFDTDGGSAVAPITQDFGTTITAPADPTKTGYTFAGWENLPATMPAGGATVKAKWTINQYTVTYKLDNGENDIVQTYDYNADVTAPADPTKTGYTFGGWTPALPGKMPAENVTAEAIWNVNEYTITFDADGGSAVDPITQDFGTEVTEPAAPTKTGYDFAGWVPALPKTMPAENISVKATWTIKKFDVSFIFFDADGTEITVTREDIEYGTAFDSLALPSKAEGYSAVYYDSAVTDHKLNINHYKFTGWTNAVDVITDEVTFVAAYEAEEHNYYDDTAAKAPTCTEPGIKAEFCNVCSFRYQEEIPASGHTWKETGRTVYCTEKGTIDYKCQVCSATKQDAVDPTGHTFSGVTEKKEPTCTENGYEAYKTCTVCNKFFAENDGVMAAGSDAKTEIPAAGHNYGTWIAEIPATCEDAGTRGHYHCDACDKNFDESKAELDSLVITAKGHSYGTWIAEIPATCEDEGTRGHYHCDACGKNFDESKAELASLVIPAKGHSYGTLIAEIPATCVKTGTKAHYDCADCDKYFDENKNELSSLVIDIDPDNHDLVNVEAKAPTCEEDGYKAYEYCKREGCDYTTYKVDSKTGHDYEGKVTTEATCLTDGVMTYTCKNDSTHTYVEAIKAEGHKFNAATERIAPKCEKTGMASYKTCSVCNKYFAADADAFSTAMYDNTDTFVIAATGHDYVGTVTAPTCEDKGYTTYICKNDSSHTNIDDYVDATGHTAAAAVIENDNPATCLENGSYQEVVYCSVCDAVLSRTDKIHVAPGHNEAVRQENIQNATCTTAGSYDNVTYCTVCDEVIKTEPVAGVTLPHNYTEKVIDADHLKSEATCTKYAVYYYDCIDCTANAKAENADTFEYEEGGFNAEKHVGTTTTADEDIEAGTCNKEKTWNEVTRCDDCKEILTSVPKTGEKDKNNHVGETYTVKDNVVAGTCTSKATWETVTKCTDCDAELDRVAEKGETDPLNHSTTETVLKDDRAATCKDKGYSGDLHCLACDAIVITGSVIDENAENHAGGTEVRKENTVPGTCMAAETWDDVTYCLGCNAELGSVAQTGAKNPENHTGNNTVTKTNVVAGTCAAKATWTEITTCECGTVVNTVNKTGEKDPTNHTGDTYTDKIDIFDGNCMTVSSWTTVTYCAGCNEELSRVAETGEKNPDIHTGKNTIKAENIVDGTCAAKATWTELTICECGVTVKTENKTGEKDPTNHTGGTYTDKIDIFDGNCMTEATWTTVTYCAGCNKELSKVAETGEKNPAVHTGVTEIKAEDIVPGTCVTEKKWNEVTYCECGEKLGTVAKTGEKDANNHEGTPTKLVDVKAPTCKEEGYTGNTLYTCCDALYKAGTSIPTTDHTPAEAVKENEIPATETKDGSYESVVYCSVCGHEISRTTVVTKVERTITFIMKDKTVEVKAYNGDTVALPDVADFTGADGFIYKFKSWDKPVAVVNGDATYTAVYNQPADWTALDNLEEILKEVLEEGVVEDSILEENKAQIEKVLGMIEDLNEERNTLDKDSQSRVDFVAGEVSGLIDVIYPDAGSTLVIEGSSVAYAGTVLDLKAVKMPLGAVLTDAQWVSSDDSIVFFANGKLYAIGTGTVTLTATRGILKASKTVTIIEGGNTRGINFTSINNTHFIIEDYAAVYNSAIVYWSDDFDLRFRVRVYQSFMFDDYIVYINGVEVEPDAEGYYVVPAGSGDARVTIAGAMIDTGAGEGEVVTKWSFWEWLLNLFRKIAEFFKGLVG